LRRSTCPRNDYSLYYGGFLQQHVRGRCARHYFLDTFRYRDDE
jgi:hypothetical protein